MFHSLVRPVNPKRQPSVLCLHVPTNSQTYPPTNYCSHRLSNRDTTILREDGEVWSTAVSQIFFSLSVTFGIMTAYGSYCPKGEPAVLNSTVVALSNSLFSFISGFAVFASLGHLAHISGVKVTELDYSGFSLGTFWRMK